MSFWAGTILKIYTILEINEVTFKKEKGFVLSKIKSKKKRWLYMVNYGEAIKRPFKDIKKLSIGAVLYMVPLLSIITGLFASGYSLTAARTAVRRNFNLPEWQDWGTLFVNGLLAAIIGLIWFIPALIVWAVVAGTSIAAALQGGDVMAALGAMGIGVVIAGLLTLAIAYISPIAVLAYAETGKFSAGFNFGAILGKAFTGKWFVAWLVALIWSIVVGVIGGLLSAALAITIVLPFVITGYISFITLVSSLTILGEAYGER